MQIFERVLLPTHACSCVQFLIFRHTTLDEVLNITIRTSLARFSNSPDCELNILNETLKVLMILWHLVASMKLFSTYFCFLNAAFPWFISKPPMEEGKRVGYN